MSGETVLTIPLAPEIRRRLGRLAKATERPVEAVAANAIANYVEHELAIIDGIERGLADMRAGRVVEHEQAMARLAATIARTERKQR